MNDRECVDFLQWALPRMRMRWTGFRKVRRQVCKRMARRLSTLGLSTVDDYRVYLSDHPGEWAVLDGCCHITVSRFYRDRQVFDRLGDEILPLLAQRALKAGRTLSIWSAGCGAGEEPYSLALLWENRVSANWRRVGVRILATDLDDQSLRRAARACFSAGSVKDLPVAWRSTAFEHTEENFCLRPAFRDSIEFLRQDLRTCMPPGPFDLILCRNLAFTYFDLELQQQLLHGFQQRLYPGGVLVIGAHERLPERGDGWMSWPGCDALFQSIDQ